MLINEMLIFYHVVQLKNFSQAAEYLGVSKSFVSKHISLLERSLKVRLLTRSTRQISLTEAGEIFFHSCQAIMQQAQQGYAAMENLKQRPSGSLKISMPAAFGLHVLADTIIEYQQLYPEVKLSIFLESQIVDIYQQGYDLVLRAALLPDSNLIAQKISDLTNVLCATPAYLHKHGVITSPDQLKQHHVAIYSQGSAIKEFEFTRRKQATIVSVVASFQANNLDLIYKMVMADACVAVLPKFMVEAGLRENLLIACLSDYVLPKGAIYAVYPEREFKPLKVKLFMALLQKNLQ